MASAAVRLLLALAGLLACAAASSLGAREPGGHNETLLPGEELPAGPLESRARRDTHLPEPITEQPSGMDPRETWKFFVRHSDRGVNARRGSRGKGRKLKLGLSGTPEQGEVQSPSGRTFSSEELRKQFQLLLKGAEAQQRQRAERGPAPEEEEEEEEEELDVDVVAVLAGILSREHRARLVEAAFHCRLRRNAAVDRRALHELAVYYLPDDDPFLRGPGLNLTSGQYTAPLTGFYALAATLHVVLPERRREQPRPRDRLRLLICIESQCQHNASLESVVGLQSSSELFTISVNGVLYLQMGQYTSVFLDNASGSPVTVQSDSQFSAVLLGV